MFIPHFVSLPFVLLPVVPVGNDKFVVRGEFVGRDKLVLREEFEGRGRPPLLLVEVVGSDGLVSLIGVVSTGRSVLPGGVVGPGESGELLGGVVGPGETIVSVGRVTPEKPGGVLVTVTWP